MRGKLMRRARTLAAQAHASSAREISAQEQVDMHTLGYGEGRRSSGDPGDKHPPTNEELTTWFGVVPDARYAKKGIQVESTTPGGPAEQAGLVKGDVLVRMGDTKLGSINRFMAKLRMRKPGDVVLVKYVRDGLEQETTVTFPEHDPK
jgi:predicted metalloprotease with PDZ domain